MNLNNITQRSNNFCLYYINRNLSNSESKLKSQCLAKGALIGLGVLNIVTGIADTAIGVALGCANVATAGTNYKIYKATISQFTNTQAMLSISYMNFLRTINPKGVFSQNLTKKFLPDDYKPPVISVKGDGLLTDSVTTSINKFARDCYTSDNKLKKHVISRLTYPVLALAYLVTRTVDGIIGLLAATFSLLTLGKFTILNNVAFRGLQAPGIIGDLFYCAVKTINPSAGIRLD